MKWVDRTHLGDCRALMRQMIADGVRVQCVVTSPPYWGLRDYGVVGQLGLERSWVRHVARMRATFRLVRELLADDGVLWLNYGDSYYSPRANGGVGGSSTINGQRTQEEFRRASRAMKSRIRPPDVDGPNRRGGQAALKAKDMVGMPWRVAFALQADGWYLRSDVIWHKPNPMPESVSDRPTKSHEYVFLLSRSERYHYDAKAIAEPASENTHSRGHGVNPKAASGWADGPGVSHSTKDHARVKAGLKDSTKFGRGAGWRRKQDAQQQISGGDRMSGFNTRWKNKQNPSFSAAVSKIVATRNVRTVWTLPTEPFSGAHFATFPRALVERCILSGSRPGDVIFDPFMGSGTVAFVAESLGRRFLGCELSPEYLALHEARRTTLGLPL